MTDWRQEDLRVSTFAVRALRRQQDLAYQHGYYPEARLARQAREYFRKFNAGNEVWSKDKAQPYLPSGQPDAKDTADIDASSSKHYVRAGSQKSPGLASSKLGTGPSRYDPKPIDVVVRQMTDQLGWARTLNVATIAAKWSEIVGSGVAAHCTVETFSDHVLVLRASSTAWANQLRLLLPTIERNIANQLGSNAVKQVIIRGPAAPSWKKGSLHIPGRGPRDTYG